MESLLRSLSEAKTDYTLVGSTDKLGTCDCCGREELQKVVILDGPNGRVFYGSGCAARALGIPRSTTIQAASWAKHEAKQAIRSREIAWKTIQTQKPSEWYKPLASAAVGGRGVSGIVVKVTADITEIQTMEDGLKRVPTGSVYEWKFIPRGNKGKFEVNSLEVAAS